DSRAEIRGVLGESLVDTLASQAAWAFARSAGGPGARFEELAKAHGGMAASGPVAPGETALGIGPIPELKERIASLPEGGVSRPIQVQNGYLVARVTHAIPPRPAEFGEAKEQALQDMELAQRRDELREELFERRTAAWTDRLRSRATIRVYRNDLKL